MLLPRRRRRLPHPSTVQKHAELDLINSPFNFTTQLQWQRTDCGQLCGILAVVALKKGKGWSYLTCATLRRVVYYLSFKQPLAKWNWTSQFHLDLFLHLSRASQYQKGNTNLVWPSVLWRCWLGGRKGIQPVKNWVVRCWRGYLSGARCRLAYGPADATATHCLLLQ